MAKVITFSRTFPAHHTKAGQPTYFVEKLYKSLFLMKVIPKELHDTWNQDVFLNGLAKHHTIRSGHRWNVGDKFSARTWGTDINPKSGRSGPYHSKQIILADNVTIEKMWPVEIESDGDNRVEIGIRIDKNTISMLPLFEVAQNDGLSMEDLKSWFNVKPGKPFHGQIICWNTTVDYDK